MFIPAHLWTVLTDFDLYGLKMSAHKHGMDTGVSLQNIDHSLVVTQRNILAHFSLTPTMFNGACSNQQCADFDDFGLTTSGYK